LCPLTDLVLDIVICQMPHHSILMFNLCVFYVFIPEFQTALRNVAEVWALLYLFLPTPYSSNFHASILPALSFLFTNLISLSLFRSFLLVSSLYEGLSPLAFSPHFTENFRPSGCIPDNVLGHACRRLLPCGCFLHLPLN